MDRQTHGVLYSGPETKAPDHVFVCVTQVL